jgi:hypothetical protein
MTCNVGGVERGIRVIVGIGLLAVGALAELSTGLRIALYIVGAVALITGVVGYCPAWHMLGINTCPTGTTEKQ